MRSWVERLLPKAARWCVCARASVRVRACVGVFGGVTVLHLQHWRALASNPVNSETPEPERSPERNRKGLGSV